MENVKKIKSENVKKTKSENETLQIAALISGVSVAYAITCVVFISYAILLRYSAVTEENISMVVTVTSLISVIVAGFDAAKGATKSGWLWGIIVGLLYALVLLAIGFFLNERFVLDSKSLVLIILSVAGGGLGGVIGINLRK